MERELFSKVLLGQHAVTFRYAVRGAKDRVELVKKIKKNLTQSEVKDVIDDCYRIQCCISNVLFEYYEFKFTDEEHTLGMYDNIEELKELQEITMRLESELNIVGENLTSGFK